MLVDSHCHLDFPKLIEDTQSVIERAEEAGVGLMVTICTKIHDIAPTIQLAETFEKIFCSVGTHPHYADQERDITTKRIVELAAHPKIVAIGEAGLDYYYERASRKEQQKSFRRHIEAARQTGLPLVIHSRDADEDTALILKEEMALGTFPALLHCFTAGPKLAENALELGLSISFSGILTFKRSDELRRIAASVPLDRLLVETDAPYLAPEPFRGKPNEPAYVKYTAATLAHIKGVSEQQIARVTSDNFFRLFAKVPDPRNSSGSTSQ